MVFSFDTKSQRFRYKTGIYAGRFVSRKDVQQIIETNIKLIANDISVITNLLLENKISVSTWESAMAAAIKKGHTQSYLLGKGGTFQFNPRDKGILGNVLSMEYMYLRRFAESINKGELTKAQIKNRAKLYANSFHKLYERGVFESHKQNGYFWEKWVTSVDGEICNDCIAFSQLSWQRIGFFPHIGVATECKTNCRCSKIYSNSAIIPETNILSTKNGWLYGTFNKRSIFN